jgi:hypothetical protein
MVGGVVWVLQACQYRAMLSITERLMVCSVVYCGERSIVGVGPGYIVHYRVSDWLWCCVLW